MKRKIHTYTGEALEVTWDKKRCIHAAVCVRELPAVFDTSERPWIQPDQAGEDDVKRAIEGCPTGALQYRRPDGGEIEEAAPETTQAQVRPQGPLYLHGSVRIENAEGELLCEDTRVALCRCGASSNKPFCDNSHREIGFNDSGEIARPKPHGDCAAGELVVSLAENGPAIAQGPLEIANAAGEVEFRGESAALCRCGASASKPFCDGSHASLGD